MTDGPVAEGALLDRPSRILVVDDQPLNILALHQMFEGEHEMFMATGGEQAIAFCRATPPDLVLLDLVMPEPGGLAVCRALAADPGTRDIPVIFVTGTHDASDEAACWDAGGVDFITKPLNAQTVRHRVRAHLTLKRQADMLRELASRDGLTGVHNRRHFDSRLEEEWRRAARVGSTLAVVSVDIDHFKRFNDTYGHLAGDDALRHVAQAVAGCFVRPGDVFARFGGEEFMGLLPGAGTDGAHRVAARIREQVRSLGIPHTGGVDGSLTVSLGVASVVPSASRSPTWLLEAADRALYLAKHGGRDCIRDAAPEVARG